MLFKQMPYEDGMENSVVRVSPYVAKQMTTLDVGTRSVRSKNLHRILYMISSRQQRLLKEREPLQSKISLCSGGVDARRTCLLKGIRALQRKSNPAKSAVFVSLRTQNHYFWTHSTGWRYRRNNKFSKHQISAENNIARGGR
jgi:hypothetical protein